MAPRKTVSSPHIEEDGYALFPEVLTSQQLEQLRLALGSPVQVGLRGILALAPVAAVAVSERVLSLVRPHLPLEPKPVRAIYFDKSPESNWLVAWHQDLTLALRERVDVPDFGPWSVKDGVPHVQPPARLLQQMLTVRLQLDDCDETNGALRVLPGSHREGRLSPQRIAELREQKSEVVCRLRAAGALLMRPLLLHASGRSRSPKRRRVVHIEYAGFRLPAGLEWPE